jgi:hypothetical protein
MADDEPASRSPGRDSPDSGASTAAAATIQSPSARPSTSTSTDDEGVKLPRIRTPSSPGGSPSRRGSLAHPSPHERSKLSSSGSAQLPRAASTTYRQPKAKGPQPINVGFHHHMRPLTTDRVHSKFLKQKKLRLERLQAQKQMEAPLTPGRAATTRPAQRGLGPGERPVVSE